MQRIIYCILLLATHVLCGALEEHASFIKPIPFKDQAHAASEFVSGLLTGTAGTMLLLDSNINEESAELLFSTVLASSAVLYSSNKRECKQFFNDYSATGRTIFFNATKSHDQQKVDVYSLAYADLRKKIDAAKSIKKNARICDNLLIAANPSLKELETQEITVSYHNNLYKNALTCLKTQHFASGLMWGACLGFIFCELFVLNARILFSHSFSSAAASYPVHSVV